MATCHPHRQAVWGRPECRPCYQAAVVLEASETRPPLFVGIAQSAAATLPDHCPHCHVGEGAGWLIEERYARCQICGTDSYQTSGRIMNMRKR